MKALSFHLIFYIFGFGIFLVGECSVIPQQNPADAMLSEPSGETADAEIKEDYYANELEPKDEVHKVVLRSSHKHLRSEVSAHEDKFVLLEPRVVGRNFKETTIKCESRQTVTKEKPLMCYQCSSTTGQKENDRCDADLWRFTRKSERYQLRTRCPNGNGTYCVKSVQSKRELQITKRGCSGPGPVKAADGSLVTLQEGCATYTQQGFLTVTCLCKSNDLCNSAPNILQILNKNNLQLLISISLIQLLAILLFLK